MKPLRARTGVSFDPEKMDRYKSLALKHHGGNLSALIESALDQYGTDAVILPNTAKSDCLVALAREIVPFVADDIANLCQGQDQRKLLAAILINFAGASYEDPNSMQLSPEFKKALKKQKGNS